jgi:hypothetical protein
MQLKQGVEQPRSIPLERNKGRTAKAKETPEARGFIFSPRKCPTNKKYIPKEGN